MNLTQHKGSKKQEARSKKQEARSKKQEEEQGVFALGLSKEGRLCYI
jgi:hypothetical protein